MHHIRTSAEERLRANLTHDAASSHAEESSTKGVWEAVAGSQVRQDEPPGSHILHARPASQMTTWPQGAEIRKLQQQQEQIEAAGEQESSRAAGEQRAGEHASRRAG